MRPSLGRAALQIGLVLGAIAPGVLWAADDPRIQVAERLIAGEPVAALAAAERFEQERPEPAADAGISYLRGRLLEELQRPVEAEAAFGQALYQSPELQPYVRYRLALAQESEGHPEVAAGLVASVVAPTTAPDLLEPATELFARAIGGGGDCRILVGVRSRSLPEPQDRLLRVVDAQCSLRRGDRLGAAKTLCGVLKEDRTGDVARRAADLLDSIVRRELELAPVLVRDGCDPEIEVGLTLHQHREYDRSTLYLERGLARLPRRRVVADDLEFDARYALARGYFWLEQFAVAADRFADLALRARDLDERSQVLYQQARCLELQGDWQMADAVFRRTYMTLQEGHYAGPSLLSALRLEWKSGLERDALDLYRLLSRRSEWSEYTARAALFMACSDIVRGRTDRAARWLAEAQRLDRDAALEVTYWQGRLAELGSGADAATAVAHYLDTVARDPYHPLALDAFDRLQSSELARLAVTRASARVPGGRPAELLSAWLVLGDELPEGREARRLLVSRFASSSTTGRLFRLQTVPVSEWPLWNDPLEDSAEKLLALGLVEEGAVVVRKHFPASDPALAYTGSRLLLEAGEVRQSMLLADAAAKPLTQRLNDAVLPRELRLTLYPWPWRETIRSEAVRQGVDPYLLTAVIREESRFDPNALSTASARGLTQFVWLTAKRMAAELGFGRIVPEDLYRPELSISLGAAYLAELIHRFGGLEHQAVAAYNAGPAQALLWQTYCYGREAPEYFTKTGFVQTRGYLRKVLGSRAQYEELYGDDEVFPRRNRHRLRGGG